MKIDSKDFRVPPGKKVELKEWRTRVQPFFKSKEQYEDLLEAHVEGLSSRQQVHYASGRYALLLIFCGTRRSPVEGFSEAGRGIPVRVPANSATDHSAVRSLPT